MSDDDNPQQPQDVPKGAPKGSPSFCIPRAALDALVRAQAGALEVCAYLTLARFTDATGVHTPASVKGVSRYTGTGKDRVEKALKRLTTIRAQKITRTHNGRSGKSSGYYEQVEDRGPILVEREAWLADHPDQALPDGPTERGRVRYVLPDFGEPREDRVWIGAGLVDGFGTFKRPLFDLKNAGPVAARLLLELYALNDMETWGGINPTRGPWQHYEPAPDERGGINLPGGARLLRASRGGFVSKIDKNVSGGDDRAYWNALHALEAIGLIYEMVTVLNRNARPAKFSSGEEYGDIPDDAEPLYELDCRSRHGFKPAGEEGLGGLTARTAGNFGRPVTAKGGFMLTDDGESTEYVGSSDFDGTYAAIVPAGSGAMVVGIYRLRFRVNNVKNAGVRDAWSRIREGNRAMYEFINAVRAFSKLPTLLPPWETAARAAADANKPAQPKVPPPDDEIDWLTGQPPRAALTDDAPAASAPTPRRQEEPDSPDAREMFRALADRLRNPTPRKDDDTAPPF
ncbi:MAG: hypothetical protein ACK46L_00365 [Synechococcaceae cyanobacterium]